MRVSRVDDLVQMRRLKEKIAELRFDLFSSLDYPPPWEPSQTSDYAGRALRSCARKLAHAEEDMQDAIDALGEAG